MSCNALSCGGGGAQTIPLVKQRLQNSQNVWNPEASRIFRLPKQIRSSLRAHVENRSPPAAPPLPDSGNTLPPPPTPPPQSAFHPFSRAAPLDRYYITFLFCSSLQARRQRRQKPDLTHFPDFPSPARAARRAHLGPERRDGGSVQERAVTPCFASKCFPLLLLNERLLQAGESGTSLGLKPKAGSAWKPREKLPPLRRFHPGGGGSSSARPSALSPAQHIWWDLRRRKWRA